MTVLVPGLLGLGAALLLLPVFIHLWSRRPATLVRVGSVKLLAGARPSQARRVALTDVPLLLLRLAIVACAGLAAAGLARRAAAGGAARVALVAPVGATAQRTADSLATAGWEVRSLEVGLPLLGTSASGREAAPSGQRDGSAAVAAWSLLRDAAERLPGVDSVLVIAPRTAAALDGVLPSLPFAVRWQHVAPEPSAAAPVRVRLDLRDASARDSARLQAALDAVTAASGRPLQLVGAGDSAQVALRVVPDLAGTATDDAPSAPLRFDAALREWLVPAAALADPAITDPLANALQLRRDEAAAIVLPATAAEPRLVAADRTGGWSSMHAGLALLALALFTVERLMASGRWRVRGST